jgi:FkbM family methyltransferase
MIHNPNFYCIDIDGKKVLRNLQEESVSKEFTVFRYWDKENGLDEMNYMYFENFTMYDAYDCNGSDYERFGCKIQPGDTVVDIGANIGMFTRRALERGAGKVISFEPMGITFSCLVDNVGFDAECHKIAIGKEPGTMNMAIPDNLLNLGGGSREDLIANRESAKKEKCLVMGLNELWNLGILPEQIDFLKIDCEGGESEIIPQLTEERLKGIRKISMEYHEGILGSELREQFMEFATGKGFNGFTFFHGDGADLVQLHFWK